MDITSCEICCEAFDVDPDAVADRAMSRLPVQSSRCPHKMCCSCLRQIKLAEADEKNKPASAVKWVKCPQCRANTCFNTDDPIVDLQFCHLIRMVRAAQGPGGTAAPSASRASLGPSSNEGAGEVSAASAEASAQAAEDDGMQETAEGNEGEKLPASVALRRSERLVHAEGEKPYGMSGSDVGGGDDATDDDEASRFSDGQYESGEEIEMEESTDVPAHDTRSQKRPRLTVNGRMHSEQDSMSTVGQDSDTKKWLAALSSEDKSLYRVRTFQNDSVCEKDRLGRKCSFWCFKSGYVASASLILTVLPKEIQKSGEACRDHVRSMDYDAFKEACRKCKTYFAVEQLKWCLTYWYFIEMKPGDIVVMQVRGKKGGTPRPYLVFGVVEDDSLTLMTKDEAVNEHGFPWDFNANKNVRGFDNGLMVRKVRWDRQGVTQAVRGLNQADWLLESMTKWLVKVKGDNDKLLKKATKKMSSKAFLESTEPIDGAWVDHGLGGL